MNSSNGPNHNALRSYTQGNFESLKLFYANSTTKTRFLNTLFQFLKHKGDAQVFTQVPILGGNFVDFFDLYRTTERHGGYEGVTSKNMWGTIATELNIMTFMEGNCNPLRQWYEIFLRSFEEVIRMKVAKHQSDKTAANKAAAAAAASAANKNVPLPSSLPPAPSVAAKPISATQPPLQQQAPTQPPVKRPRVDLPPAPSNTTTTTAPSVFQPNAALSTVPFIPKQDPKRFPERVHIDKATVDAAIKNIRSKRLGDVVQGLNFLNQASMEPDQIQLNANRSPFYIDNYPLVVVALGELMDSLNPCVNVLFPATDYTTTILEQSDQYYWKTVNPVVEHEDIQVAAFKNLDNNKLYMSVLNIIRNITFEVTNVQLVSYSATIIRHVSALLLLSSPASCMLMEATSYALDILFNIGIYVDITGTRRMKKTLSDCSRTSSFEMKGVERELLILSTSPAFSANSKDTYTQATSHLFPTLLRWLRCSDRGTVLRVIRILGRLASVPENILSLDMMCPDDDLGFLVQLLCASETAVESLCTSKGQLPSCMRATPYKETSKVNAGVIEDFNDFSDLKIRDAVLETLLALVVPYSATLKERIASQPRCVHLIARIALRSCSKPKHDGFSKDAVSILSALSTEPRNRKHILPVVSNLSKAALSDEAIADMMTSPAMRSVIQQPLPLSLTGGLATDAYPL